MTLALVFGATGAWADEITATLVHTASSYSDGSKNFTSTVDAAAEHINNSNFSNGWAGAAYAEFSFEIPAGSTIKSAELAWSGIGSGKNRNTDVMYVTDGTLDYDALSAGNANINLTATKIETVSFPANKTTDFKTNVTDAVKAAEGKIIFKFTNNPGGGDLVGKGASEKAPVLTITTVSAAAMTQYTVKFTNAEGTELKEAAKYDITIGEKATASEADMAPFFNADNTMKYIYVSGNEEITAAESADANVITLVFRDAEKFAYAIKSSLGTTLKEGTNWEGETFKVAYPRHLLSEGTLYTTPAGDKSIGYFQKQFTLNSNNQEETIEYTAGETGIVFLAEAENIKTLTTSTAANSDIRCSDGLCAYNAGQGDTTIVVLPAGKYKLYTSVWGNAGTDFVFKAGEEQILSLSTAGYIVDGNSEEFTLNKRTAITLSATANSGRGIDFVYIQKTGDVALVSTPRKWDFTNMGDADDALFAAQVEAGVWSNQKGRYQNDNTVFDNEPIVIEGTEIEMTKGLLFTADKKKLLLGAKGSKYKFIQVQKGASFVLPDLAVGDTVRTTVQTAKDATTLAALDAEMVKVVEGFEATKEKHACTFVILKDGDVTLKGDNSDLRFFNLEVITPVEEPNTGKTIAEFKALADSTEATLAVNNTKVTFVGGGNAYIEDETGALLLENTGLALTAGKAITGTIEGKFVNDKGLAKLVATEATANSKFTEADAEITATLMTVEDASKAENVSKLVKFENVTANLDYQSIEQGEDGYISFVDKYEVLNGTCPTKVASIVGIIGTVSGYNMFYPVSPDSIVAAAIPEAKEVKSIAEMKAVEDGTEVNFVMNNVKVTTCGFSARGYFCTIEDETGAVAVGANMVSSIFMESGVTAGMAITGHVRGTYTVANGMPTFDISEYTGAADELTATEATIEPTEATIAGVKNAESIAKYVILKDVKMTATQEGWETFYTAAQGEETISVVDALMDRMTYQGVLSKYMDEETGVVTLPEMFESVSAIVTVNETGDYVLYPTAVVEKEAQEEIPVVWDFTKWSEETVANLAAEAATVVPDGDGKYPEVTPWRSYEKKEGPTEKDPDRGGAAYWYGTAIESAQSITANGAEIAETAGLLFDKMGAGSLAIALNYPETTLGTYAGPAYLWIGGKQNSFVIPAVKPGSTIEIKIESHKPAEGRGVKLSVGGTVIGEAIPTTVETFRIEVPAAETETVDVKVENTNGCHIYTIGITDYTKIDTGISGINNDVKTVDGVYTINGVKVRNAGESLNGLAKGLYIIGGKKVVIK